MSTSADNASEQDPAVEGGHQHKTEEGGIFDQGHPHEAGDPGQGVFEQGHQHASGERGQGVFEQGHAEAEDPEERGQGVYDQGAEE